MENVNIKFEEANIILLYIKELLNYLASTLRHTIKPQIRLFLKFLEKDKVIYYFDKVHRLETASRMASRAVEKNEQINQLYEILGTSTSVAERKRAVENCFSKLKKESDLAQIISSYVSNPYKENKPLEAFADRVYQSSLKFINAYNCNHNGIAECTALEDRFNTLQFRIDEAITSGTPASQIKLKR